MGNRVGQFGSGGASAQETVVRETSCTDGLRVDSCWLRQLCRSFKDCLRGGRGSDHGSVPFDRVRDLLPGAGIDVGFPLDCPAGRGGGAGADPAVRGGPCRRGHRGCGAAVGRGGGLPGRIRGPDRGWDGRSVGVGAGPPPRRRRRPGGGVDDGGVPQRGPRGPVRRDRRAPRRGRGSGRGARRLGHHQHRDRGPWAGRHRRGGVGRGRPRVGTRLHRRPRCRTDHGAGRGPGGVVQARAAGGRRLRRGRGGARRPAGGVGAV